MRTYMISYDLAQPARNQHDLAHVIMSVGEKWARPLSGTWYVTSERDEVELESELKNALGDDDGLIIQAIKREAAMTNTSLRWFRQRRSQGDGDAMSNVVNFPNTSACGGDADTTLEPELPLAQAC